MSKQRMARELDDQGREPLALRSGSPPAFERRPPSRALEQKEAHRSPLAADRHTLADARAQLRQSYLRYNELYESAPVGFLTLDRAARIRGLNEKTARMLAFPLPWLIGKPFLVFVARSDIQRFLTHFRKSISTTDQRTIELELSVGDHLLPVQISTKSSDHGGETLCQLTIVDLTDTKRTEKHLQELLDNWHSLVQNAPDIVMTVERNRKITFVNKPVWGYSVQALVGTRITDHVAAHERVKLRRCISHVFETGLRTSCEIYGVNSDKRSWFSFSFGPTHHGVDHAENHAGDDAGDVPEDHRSTTLMIREISEHKLAEETLRTSGEQLREFAARVEAVREEERTRVSREIHDELGQALTVLKLDLSWLQGKMPRGQPELRNKMKSVLVQVDATIDRVRKIASELRPSMLDDLGLLPAIEWHVEEFQKRTGIRCKVQSGVDGVELGPEASGALFRVVQEALTNVVRHAAASCVQIDLTSDGRDLRMSLKDDGKGAAEEQLNDMRSLGIVGMRERISRVGGKFKIQSQRGQGTRIEIRVPIQS